MPGVYFRRIPVGDVSLEYLEGVGEAWLIDKVPAEPRHTGKAPHNSPHVGLLGEQGLRIEIRIFSGRCILRGRCGENGSECKEGEVDRDAVVMSADEKGLEIAQKAFIRLSRSAIDKFGMVHPNAGAEEGDAMGRHFRKLPLPHRRIARAREIPAIVFCGEVVGADRKKWLAT